MLTRCLELEKLQLATEKLEESKSSKTRQFMRQRSASTALSRARAQSARSAKAANTTKCAQDCVQVVCVGDCPEKQSPCSICNKRTCNESCTPTPYTNHTRQPSADNSIEPPKQRQPRPTSCGPCAKPNQASKINKQQTNMGRPRSSHSTFSQAKKAVREPYGLRTSLQQLEINDIDVSGNSHNKILSLRPTSSRVRSARSRRGRDTIAPHKSYHSQRRISLTANSIRPVFGANLTSANKKRARSAKSASGNS